MDRQSLVSYLDDFQRLGKQGAYAQSRGYRTEHWSYQQVANFAFQFAREIDGRGIGKGDHVLLWGHNCAEWIAVFLGCMWRGAIVVPVDHASAPDFALRVQQQVSAKVIVCSREHAAHFPGEEALVLEDLASTLRERSNVAYPPQVVSGNDALEIVFTSGTTAEPKGVVITHGNVLANVAPFEREIRKFLKYEKLFHPIRFLNLLPLSHVFGQFLGIFLPPLLAGTVWFQESLNPSEVISAIKKRRVSVLVAVPRLLQSLKDKVERDLEASGQSGRFRERFQSVAGQHFLRRWWTFRRIRRRFGWKFWAFICGGASLDRATEEFWDRLGYAVIQGYGLTETTSLISVNHPFKLGRGSIGKVLPGREIKLAPDGEILVRGGGVAAGYFSHKALTAVTGEDGWYHTGDVGELDAAGHLYFKGRKKDVIVTPAGMNIYPEDLEFALRRQPQVRDCVVIGLERNGNLEPCAVVVLRNKETNPEEILCRANESLAEYQRMHLFYKWPDEDFPRTSTQKPRRKLIHDTVRENFGAAQSASPRSALAELIGRFSPGATPNLDPDADLQANLGLSSLDRVELLGALEDRYQIDLRDTNLAAASTVGDLERLLRGAPSESVEFHYPRWALRWPVTWIRTAAYYIAIRPAISLLGRPHISGLDNLRKLNPPVLIVSNHIDDVDPGFILAALPGRFRHRLVVATGGEALERLRTSPVEQNALLKIYNRAKWMLGVALLNLFPLPREAGFRRSFQFAGEAVDRGFSVLVFPEGRHTKDGELLRFRAGIGLLANNLQVPIVPVRIRGLFELKQTGRRIARSGEIRVHIGQPVQFAPDTDPERIAQQLRETVNQL
ncbi:MAG TPA: AMP-binding protein [Terriglobales bacterium]|nr:AMP-binding protein [Terriglobales bacterium]